MKNGSYATYGQENYKNGKREREDRKRERESNVLSRLTFNSILLLSYKMLLSCDTQCVSKRYLFDKTNPAKSIV